jgi:uncharacterized protein (DUF1697 family)
MTRYVALLRGVNVGGATVRSADLADMARRLGLEDVATVLASGNLLVTSDDDPAALTTRLEAALSERFGYDARIVLTTADRLAAVVDAYPFDPERDGYHAYVLFGTDQAQLDQLVAAAADLPPADEKVAPGDGVVYWECPKGSTLQTPFAKLTAKRSPSSATGTNRNIRTLRKILAKA